MEVLERENLSVRLLGGGLGRFPSIGFGCARERGLPLPFCRLDVRVSGSFLRGMNELCEWRFALSVLGTRW